MSCADSIAKLLADAHFSCYFSKVLPSALDCAEPIVVVEGAFSRDARMAEDVAVAAELAVRRADWEPYADAGAYRIIGIDTTAPAFKERDSSGRHVWAFDVKCTVVRSL